MGDKEVLYTDELGVRRWESGEVFCATPVESSKYNERFTVSSHHIIERNSSYVVIDTCNDANL